MPQPGRTCWVWSAAAVVAMAGMLRAEPLAVPRTDTQEVVEPPTTIYLYDEVLAQPVQPQPSTNQPPEELPPTIEPITPGADSPITAPSSLLSQLSRAQERAAQSAAPSTSAIDVREQSSAIEVTQYVKQSSAATSISGVRRSPLSIQPVIRGYSQSQIYGQFQGGQFVPARIDFDSMLGSIDPGIIDNMIIVPGPYGLKYGPGLAYIDIVATPTPRYDVAEFHSRTNILTQSNGGQFYIREAVTGGGPDYGLRVSVGQKVGSDYRGGDNSLIPASYNARDVDIAWGRDIGENSQFEIEFLTQDLVDTEFAGLVFDANFRKTDALFLTFNFDDPYTANWLFQAWINRTVYSGDNLRPSKQIFYRNSFIFNSQGATTYPPASFTGFTNGDVTNAGFRLAPTWGEEGEEQFTFGVDFHYVGGGIDEFDLFQDKTLQISTTGYDNFPVPPATQYDPGFFMEWKKPINDDLTVAAGARYDLVTSDADGTHRAVAPDGTVPPIIGLNSQIYGSYEELMGTPFFGRRSLLAAYVSADMKLNEDLNLRAGFGHGERAPNATELYAYLPFLTVLQTPENAPLGNSLLKAEKASQFDLSLQGNYETVRYQVSGFASMIHDYITQDYYSFPTSPTVRTFRYFNTEAVLAGFEAAGEKDVTENLSGFFNMSYVYGQDIIRDQPLASIFPFQSRFGIRIHDPERQYLGLEFSARLVAPQNRVYATLLEPTTPGFSTFDLRAYWQANENLRLTGGVENFTNTAYIEHLNVHNPPVLEPGANIYVAVQTTY
ncbi:MAG: TonB-dependent receptor [Pirellulaceae bacterium]